MVFVDYRQTAVVRWIVIVKYLDVLGKFVRLLLIRNMLVPVNGILAMQSQVMYIADVIIANVNDTGLVVV